MIHKYKLNGYNIVLDVNSNCIYAFDEISYDIVEYIDSLHVTEQTEILSSDVCPESIVSHLSYELPSEVKKCFEEIAYLYRERRLFSDDKKARELFEFADIDSPIKAMCLNVAHSCNMRCKYCFAESESYVGEKKMMPLYVAINAINFLVAHSGKRRVLEVDFFGGEPLLNWEVVKQTVAYARTIENKTFNFTITTNGLLLDDEKIDYINAEMSNVVLSLDGRKSVHDHMRLLPDGLGSYDVVLENFLKLAEKRKPTGKDFYIRGTFTKNNLDFTEDVFDLHNLGFEHISLEPVTASADKDYAITNYDLSCLFTEYERLACKILDWQKANDKYFDFFHFNLDIDEATASCLVKRVKGCGSGNEYIAVTPNGDIYPCHQFIGFENFKMGNITENTFNNDIKTTFANAHIYKKHTCGDCWAKFYCCGGCNAISEQFKQDILTPVPLYCQIQKKRLECAIMLQVAMKK